LRIACRWEWLAARANAQGMQEVPEKIGDYEVVRELGRGAMGVVYLARHPALGREMALKVMAPELARDPEFPDHTGHHFAVGDGDAGIIERRHLLARVAG
jgi:serine/threonine protein kinase